MKTFFNTFGAIAIFVGILAMAGSAGDCDGKCMDQANDIATMLMIIGYGLIAVIGGAACIAAASRFE